MAIKINKEVGQKIFKARKAKKMTRVQLGELVGLHETTIKKYEDGNIKNLSVEKLKDFSNALDIQLLDMIHLVTTEEEIESINDALACVEILYQSLSKTLAALQNLGLQKEDIKAFIQKYILDDPESPIYEYTHEHSINVYENVKVDTTNLKFGPIIDKIINPYPNTVNSTFSLKTNDASMINIIPQNTYAVISEQKSISNGEIALICIDNNNGILRKFYHLNDSTIVLQPDTSDTNFKTSIFEGEDIKRIKIIGKYIGYVSPFQQ